MAANVTLRQRPVDIMDSLHSVVPRALTELFRQGPLSQGKLEVAWRVAVGDALARVTTVRLQPDGVVEVRTADQRWNRELKRSSSDDPDAADRPPRRRQRVTRRVVK